MTPRDWSASQRRPRFPKTWKVRGGYGITLLISESAKTFQVSKNLEGQGRVWRHAIDQRVNECDRWSAVGGRQSVVGGGYGITPHVSCLTSIGLQAVRR
ncbi:MAG: hypothetical protein ABIG63_07355 [Chloroflexota bacterium]